MDSLSPYLITVIVAWVLAQGLKYVISSIKGKGFRRNVRQLYLSGNMPSAHSSTVVALMTFVGYRDGMDSAIFAVVTLFASIVMYDAMMVRRSSGEQGKALTLLIKETKSKVNLPHVAKGHTPIEVLAGALLGLSVGIVAILVNL